MPTCLPEVTENKALAVGMAAHRARERPHPLTFKLYATGRPVRAAVAAAAMWTIWVLAYLTGMSGASWFASYHRGAPGGLSAAADQQIAVAILWAVPALCFLPFLYVMVIAWLVGSTSPAGSKHPAASDGAPAGWPRPPRGWRSPHTR